MARQYWQWCSEKPDSRSNQIPTAHSQSDIIQNLIPLEMEKQRKFSKIQRRRHDKISHELLLRKLKKVRIGRNSLKQFRSYLKNRKQTAMIREKNSCYQDVFRRVPRNSISKRLSFLLFKDDLSFCALSKKILICRKVQSCRQEPS